MSKISVAFKPSKLALLLLLRMARLAVAGQGVFVSPSCPALLETNQDENGYHIEINKRSTTPRNAFYYC